MEKTSIETLASQYGLTVDFVKELHDKIVFKKFLFIFMFILLLFRFLNNWQTNDAATETPAPSDSAQ